MVLAAYLLMSAITFALYGLDKWRAARPRRGNERVSRIPERTLHGLELAGGWPGALIAQQVFRHKRSKTAYMRVFWVIVALHVGVWAWVVVR